MVLSFVLAGVASIFAALCYAEFASLVPMAGSAYTYGYATLGEFIAWIIGWDLVLEYALGAVTVAVGWSGLRGVASCDDIGIDIPAALRLRAAHCSATDWSPRGAIGCAPAGPAGCISTCRPSSSSRS